VHEPVAPGWRREWRAPLLCFVTANALNAFVCAACVALGWGLRGSSYEPGRPTPEDVTHLRVLHVMLALALGLNLGTPALFAIRGQWKIVLGFVAAWITIPMAYIVGLLILAVVFGTLWS
jgi:hypothetical protein